MTQSNSARNAPSLWLSILLPALAGGMGWGIRGQYGHETGAMIAGVLVGGAISLLYLRHRDPLTSARVIALTAIGISFGGSMTYGQTVGLTHNPEVIGNVAALTWGLLGLFVKGAVWIGLAGAFLGIGLSSQTYRPLVMALVLFAMIGLHFVGVALFNQPYQPHETVNEVGEITTPRVLPKIYFSEHPDWYPTKAELKPRRENWGGLLCAWLGLFGYLALVRRDRIASVMAIAGVVAGGIGFAGGQCVQAFHAWHPTEFGWLGSVEPLMNWWNMMEITFGLILGGGLGLGVWMNRRRIPTQSPVVTLPADIEIYLAGLLGWIIVGWNFLSIPQIDFFADRALPIGLIPIIGILGGRWFPYLFAFPLVALPIAGKTLRQLVYQRELVAEGAGWIWLVVVPLTSLLFFAIVAAGKGGKHHEPTVSRNLFVRCAVILTTWVYFWLNFAFFESPWPWNPSTSRTPSAWIFVVCGFGLTIAALTLRNPDAELLETTRQKRQSSY